MTKTVGDLPEEQGSLWGAVEESFRGWLKTRASSATYSSPEGGYSVRPVRDRFGRDCEARAITLRTEGFQLRSQHWGDGRGMCR